nr:immunoglobulin light chain junction region [Macaca mulatta]
CGAGDSSLSAGLF